MAITPMNLKNLNCPVAHFTDKESRDKFDLNPDCQRGSVWNVERKRALIFSLLSGIPIGSIITNKRPRDIGVSRVIDGKQRLEAIRDFMDDKFSVPAEWFESPSDAATEVKFSELSIGERRGFEFRPIAMLLASVPEEKETELFNLINFGGVSQGSSDL